MLDKEHRIHSIEASPRSLYGRGSLSGEMIDERSKRKIHDDVHDCLQRYSCLMRFSSQVPETQE
ncbi:hypothetical protein E4U22_006120 [Claviceps purpurea]|nr:hypothetical protein E4U12_001807 [Claviceps purpurea]KAG6317572.1 hypothetical protein E4U22_006120 [Claviceps purpurea]